MIFTLAKAVPIERELERRGHRLRPKPWRAAIPPPLPVGVRSHTLRRRALHRRYHRRAKRHLAATSRWQQAQGARPDGRLRDPALAR